MKKIPAAVLGASGYVGQRFVSLLQDHPYFELKELVASSRSEGKSFAEAIHGREVEGLLFRPEILQMKLRSSERLDDWSSRVRLVFSAVNMPKEAIVELEESLLRRELVVVSNNSALRSHADVPMLIPEINADHCALIPSQRKRLGIKKGFAVCKPNCSIQSYVPILSALREFGPELVTVSTYQAISGAGKNFNSWPEMKENLIPFISGEEKKSEEEPLKIWGHVADGKIVLASDVKISAQCYRVAVQEGHTAAVSVRFRRKPSREEIMSALRRFNEQSVCRGLPSAPEQMIHIHEEDGRPQVKADITADRGMCVHFGQLRDDPIFDYKFTGLSHNTMRGAAGGAVLSAEYLFREGWLDEQ